MKCIKCSYTSFDYNQTCPKCGKDLSAEAEKLHLPSYKPAPPYLLTSFTGETGDNAGGRGNAEYGISSLPEEQHEDIFLLDTDGLEAPETMKKSALNDGENELMVALDELSFEYEPAKEQAFEAAESIENMDPFPTEMPQEIKPSEKEADLFDNEEPQSISPFSLTDDEEPSFAMTDPGKSPEEDDIPEDYLELDLSDIHQTEDLPEDDEMLISLDDLSFDQEEPERKQTSSEQQSDGEDALSMSEAFHFDEENAQEVRKGQEDDVAIGFAPVDTKADPYEDDNVIQLSPEELSLEEDVSETSQLRTDPEEISFIPDLTESDEPSSEGDLEIADLFSEPQTEEPKSKKKPRKKKVEKEDSLIDLDSLELEMDQKDS